MDDQGENIVFLARALLNTSAENSTPTPKKTQITMTFQALCLTTILAAVSGSAVTAWAHESERPLNRYERFEAQALVFYAAKLKGIDEHTLRHEVEQKIGIPHFDDMTASDFPAVRRYLQEKAQ